MTSRRHAYYRINCTLIYKKHGEVASRCFFKGNDIHARINSLGQNGIIMHSSLKMQAGARVELRLTALRVARSSILFSGPFDIGGRVTEALPEDSNTWKLIVRFLTVKKVTA